MAQNAVIFELTPDDAEINMEKILEEIKKRLPEDVELKDSKIEPFVFGLKKLKILLIIPESQEKLKEIEEILNSIEGVSAEVQSLTRI